MRLAEWIEDARSTGDLAGLLAQVEAVRVQLAGATVATATVDMIAELRRLGTAGGTAAPGGQPAKSRSKWAFWK